MRASRKSITVYRVEFTNGTFDWLSSEGLAFFMKKLVIVRIIDIETF